MFGTFVGVQESRAILRDDVSGGWVEKANIMRALAQRDVTDPELVEHWREAMRQARIPDRKVPGVSADRVSALEIRAWFDYLRSRIRYAPASLGYSNDPSNGGTVFRTQVLIRPAVLFRRGYGDCTAFSTAGAAGLAIAGYDSDFVLVSLRPDKAPSHVYLRVWYPARTHGKAVAFDGIAPHPLGWEPPANRTTWARTIPIFRPWGGDSIAPRAQLMGFGG